MGHELIDSSTLKEYLDEIVEEFGFDHVYAPRHRVNGEMFICSYNPTDVDNVGCIIGVVLRRHGINTEGLQGTVRGITDPNDNLVHFFTEEAQSVAHRVQQFQDQGMNWGLAVRLATSDISMRIFAEILEGDF